MLNIVGLGLQGLSSITIGGAEAIRSSDEVYLDSYTSVLQQDALKEISEYFDRKIIPVERDFIEGPSPILDMCRTRNISLLVVGDGMSATTHKILEQNCASSGVTVRVFENASILNVIPWRLGLYTYKMGPPVSLPFLSDSFFPTSVFSKIIRNHSNGMHTIVLLDLKSGQTIDILQALEWLQEMEKRAGGDSILSKEEICVVSRVRQPGEKIIYGSIEKLKTVHFGSPASIVIPSNPDTFEKENLAPFRASNEN